MQKYCTHDESSVSRINHPQNSEQDLFSQNLHHFYKIICTERYFPLSSVKISETGPNEDDWYLFQPTISPTDVDPCPNIFACNAIRTGIRYEDDRTLWCPDIPSPHFDKYLLSKVDALSETRRAQQRYQDGAFRLLGNLFADIRGMAEAQNIYFAVDAFAADGNKLFDPYWSYHTNAFDKNWNGVDLWLHPPQNLSPR